MIQLTLSPHQLPQSLCIAHITPAGKPLPAFQSSGFQCTSSIDFHSSLTVSKQLLHLIINYLEKKLCAKKYQSHLCVSSLQSLSHYPCTSKHYRFPTLHVRKPRSGRFEQRSQGLLSLQFLVQEESRTILLSNPSFYSIIFPIAKHNFFFYKYIAKCGLHAVLHTQSNTTTLLY